LRSGRPRGPGKALKNVGGFASHNFEGFPGPPGPARPQKRTPKKPGQTAFRYPEKNACIESSTATLQQPQTLPTGGIPETVNEHDPAKTLKHQDRSGWDGSSGHRAAARWLEGPSYPKNIEGNPSPLAGSQQGIRRPAMRTKTWLRNGIRVGLRG
jgi:hypothetical protein